MRTLAQRKKVRFTHGDTHISAWHYPGTNGACVVMASGLAVTKEPGTDAFARRFHDAGYSVLAFDFRRFGESSGSPRQVMRPRDQVADWRAAVDHAAALPEVDAGKVAIWGFSMAGGHAFRVAARNPKVAAVIAQSPFTDGQASTPVALKYQTPLGMLRLMSRAVADAVGALLGRPPRLVPLDGPRGTVALLTTPDAGDSGRALNPGNKYPEWQQEVAARAVLRVGFYRPGRQARHVACPVLVVACDNDTAAPSKPAVRAANRAPRGELVRVKGGHYAPFLDEHETVVTAELDFLKRSVLKSAVAGPAGRGPRSVA